MPQNSELPVPNLFLASLPEAEVSRPAFQAGSRRSDRPKVEMPNPVDVRVGARLRLRRNMLGLSQEKLGELIGLTFQQIQKYERGANRIGASRLYELSRVLDVPVSFFFDDTDPVRAPAVDGFAQPPVEAEATHES